MMSLPQGNVQPLLSTENSTNDELLLDEYTPYIRRAAKWFCYRSLQSRISYDDFLQEGFMTLIALHRADRDASPSLIRHAIRISMLNLALRNYSALHVTTHAFKKSTCAETRQKAQKSLTNSIPLHQILEEEREHLSPGLQVTMDESNIFVHEFLEGLTERERAVCHGLMNDASEREISRGSDIPHITVRRIHALLRKKLGNALIDPF